MEVYTNYNAAVIPCDHGGGRGLQKISAIYRAGTSQSETGMLISDYGGHGHHGAAGDFGFAVGSVETQTHLAALLSPPLPPDARSAYVQTGMNKVHMTVWAINFVLFLLLGGAMFNYGGDERMIDFMYCAVGCGFLIVVVTIIWKIYARRLDGLEQEQAEQLKKQQREYQRKCAVWDRLLYCPQCDTVIDATTGASMPPTDCRAYLRTAQLPS